MGGWTGRVQEVEVVGELLGGFVGAVHREAEVYVVLDSADGDWELQAFAVFAEERIEGSEQDGFPAGDHLRGHGIGTDMSEELEGGAVDGVGPVHLGIAARNLVVKRRDEQEGAPQGKVYRHLGGDFGFEVAAGCFGVSGMALGTHAEGVDTVLQLGVGELDGLDVDLSGELHLLDNADIAGRDMQFGVEGDVAAHDGRLGFHAEFEQIFDTAVRHEDGEVDVVALAVDIDDGTLGAEVGVKECGLNRGEDGVAVGGVDEGVEGGLKRDWVVRDVEREVGDAVGAVDGDVIEASVEVADAGEGSTDAADGAEVGVGEGVMAVDLGGAGIVAVPRAEVAGGVDGADGLGINEERVVEHGLAHTDVGEFEILDGKTEGSLLRIGVLDDEVDVFAEDFRDGDLDARVGCRDVGGMGSAVRGDVQVHAVDVNARDVGLKVQQFVQGGVEDEVIDTKHGRSGHALLLLQVGLGGAGEVKNAKATAFDLEASGNRDFEGVEFDGRVEAIAERGDDAAAEDGTDVVGDVLRSKGGCDQEYAKNGRDGGQPTVTRAVGAVRL